MLKVDTQHNRVNGHSHSLQLAHEIHALILVHKLVAPGLALLGLESPLIAI